MSSCQGSNRVSSLSTQKHPSLSICFLKFSSTVAFLLCYAPLTYASSDGNNSTTGSDNSSTTDNHSNNSNGHNAAGDHHGGGIHIFRAEFGHVAKPFVVCAWVLTASLAKIGELSILYCILYY